MTTTENESDFNFFRHYSQEENHFTHSLIVLLAMSKFAPAVDHTATFARELLREFGFLKQGEDASNIGLEMLRYPIQPEDAAVDGAQNRLRSVGQQTQDAKIVTNDACVFVETKIRSGTLDEKQIRRHLAHLEQITYRPTKRLVLLTPDDSESEYIKRLIAIDAAHIVHVEWGKIRDWLIEYKNNATPSALRQAVHDFIVLTKEQILSQDIAGVIAKLRFGNDTGVQPETYIHDITSGKWNETGYGLPRKCVHLEGSGKDGTGRKLLLYDPKQQRITIEIEVAGKVDDPGTSYPHRYQFARTPEGVDIRLDAIRNIDGGKFRNFGSERAPYRVVTHTEYASLKRQENLLGKG